MYGIGRAAPIGQGRVVLIKIEIHYSFYHKSRLGMEMEFSGAGRGALSSPPGLRKVQTAAPSTTVDAPVGAVISFHSQRC